MNLNSECDKFVKYKKIDRNIERDVSLFKKYFGFNANLQFARAPGRVNIIGEHIDYCGYSVFPMAIKNDIFITFATKPTGNTVSLRNTNDIYEQFDVDVSKNEIEIDIKYPKWYNYFLCGYKGIMDYVHENNLELGKQSLYVLINGDIPPNAGLSSSSALVVCSALVTMKCFDLNIPKKTLANLCASCERYIGTQGGGMDQCISIMAQSGMAMIIDFGPKEMSNESIHLPANCVFIVTNSLHQMNKAASNQFNQRVVESRLSAKLLLKLIQPEIDIRRFKRMSDVQDFLKLDYEAMSYKIDELIKEHYTRETLLDLLHLSDDVFSTDVLSPNTKEMSDFHLYNRAKHVIDEARRVMEFRNICLKEDGDIDKLTLLGNLMNESQNSLRDLYECSSEHLDELVDICRRAGSYGSRLTGAGWGGCVISLVSPDRVDKFLNFVAENFYKRPLEQIENEMFVTSPSDGAAFFIM